MSYRDGYSKLAGNHVLKLRDSMKKEGVSGFNFWMIFLKTLSRFAKDVKKIETREEWLKFFNENKPFSYDGDVEAEFNALQDENEQRFFGGDLMVKYLDKIYIEEAVKKGIPQEKMEEIMKPVNREVTQEMADLCHVTLVDGKLPKQEEQEIAF